MKTIKYFDKIHNKMLELEVNDEVAKFLEADKKHSQRQRIKDYENISFSLDEKTSVDGEIALTYNEIIPDENSNIEKILEKKAFKQCVWNVVDKLNEDEAKAIKLFFWYGYKASEIAKYFNMSVSAFTQWKSTILKHLRILFSYDEQFKQTEFFKSHYKKFSEDMEKQTKESLAKDVYSVDLNSVSDLIKTVTQTKKTMESLNIKLSKKDKKTIDFMTKTLQEFFKTLKKNGKFTNNGKTILNIPMQKLMTLIKK